jgi:outer membrane protein
LAEPLQEALGHAYRTNPTVAVERANLALLGEDVVEARAPGQPRISVLTSHTETVKKAIASTLVPERTWRSDLSMSVPLYRGGAVKHAVLDARSRYAAGWEIMRSSTTDLFGAVVVAYCDVLRDEAIVSLSERDVMVMEANLKGARGRFRIGDLTVTDVAQSEARLELAQGTLRAARARLISSREDYLRIVGKAPSGLVMPAAFDGLPATVEGAIEIAMNANPALRASRLTIAATEHGVRSAQAERNPRITAVGSGGYYDYMNSVSSNFAIKPRQSGSSVQLGLTLEIPLYQGGIPASHVRRAREARARAMELEIEAERGVIAQVRSAFANWKLLMESEGDAVAAIEANERAVMGAKAENGVGTRTLLDVLDAERDLFNSQIALLSIRRDAFVASFGLLAAMGRADPEDLGLIRDEGGAERRPPRVRRSWSDWADGNGGYRRVGTPTLQSDAQNGAVE